MRTQDNCRVLTGAMVFLLRTFRSAVQQSFTTKHAFHRSLSLQNYKQLSDGIAHGMDQTALMKYLMASTTWLSH
jgi:hypothetical protein